MKRPAWIVSLTVAALIVAWSGQVLAQVGQVNNSHALDRNLRVGSGGRNEAAPQRGMYDSQLIASDQVTGLAGFRGPTLVAPDQLRITPPSAYLDRFMGQSVGVAQAATGGTYAPTEFLSSARTVYTAAPQGLMRTTPSTYVAPSVAGGNAAAAIEQAYTDVRRPFNDVLPIPSRATAGRGDDPFGQEQSYVTPSAPVMPVDTVVTGVSVTSEFRQREGLARELIEAQRALRNASGDDTGLDASGQRTTGQGTADGDEGITRGGFVKPREGQDVFVDLLIALKKAQDEAAAVHKPKSPGDVEIQPLDEDEVEQQSDQARADAPLVEFVNNQIVVHGLAGPSQDLFNRYMTRGQTGLRDGRYYEAARSFDFATMLNDANPLAVVGQGMAVFGAGEFYTASNLFRRALESFPPLMQTRLEMATMIKKGDFAQQLKVLNEHVAPDDADTPLLFLATFANYNAGKTKTARALATRLAERDDARPVVKTFAAYIKTGKIPKTLPATAAQPAPAARPQ